VHIALKAAGCCRKRCSLPQRFPAFLGAFEVRPEESGNSVLPPILRHDFHRAAATFGWERYVGIEGVAIGIDRVRGFGTADV
jgi:transketolase